MEYVVADADEAQLAVVKSQTGLPVVPRQYWAALALKVANATVAAAVRRHIK